MFSTLTHDLRPGLTYVVAPRMVFAWTNSAFPRSFPTRLRRSPCTSGEHFLRVKYRSGSNLHRK